MRKVNIPAAKQVLIENVDGRITKKVSRPFNTIHVTQEYIATLRDPNATLEEKVEAITDLLLGA